MSAIEEFKARLLQAPTPFTYVRGATALSQVKDRPPGVLPVAFVLTAREVSAANTRMTGKVLQRSERDITVVIVCEDLGDADGDQVQDQLETLKAFNRSRLIGFLPSDGIGEPVTHVSGEMVQATGGTCWFEDVFSSPTHLIEAP